MTEQKRTKIEAELKKLKKEWDKHYNLQQSEYGTIYSLLYLCVGIIQNSKFNKSDKESQKSS